MFIYYVSGIKAQVKKKSSKKDEFGTQQLRLECNTCVQARATSECLNFRPCPYAGA